jgi:SNF2 family DNA or RNA helicase
MELKKIIADQIQKTEKVLDKTEKVLAEILYNNGDCQILSQSSNRFELIVYDTTLDEPIEVTIIIDNKDVFPESPTQKGWNRFTFACLLQVENELAFFDPKTNDQHQKYSRAGMIKRVLDERRQKAAKAKYTVKWANNIFGDHILTNEKGLKYRVFLRDFENETGYSDSADAQKNKLGTTKHIMYAFKMLKEDKKISAKMSKTFPFVEVYCDPLNDYKITWHYPNELSVFEKHLISKYFKNKTHIEDDELTGFLDFFIEAEDVPSILIRPEVRQKVEAAYEQKLLNDLKNRATPDFSSIKADLYPYQKEGAEFCLFKKYAIIADEMGLGKTLQAIAVAILKKKHFGFKKTLIVCPASLKEQWKKEIEKFSNEKAVIVQGTPDERAQTYLNAPELFIILNYETVLRDYRSINKAGIDFMILDEAQKVKNFETKTAAAVNNIQSNHTLVITGTPIENKLIDVFSIVNILDPHFFGPLWEFSYQHCLFDPSKPNKINGYYDLKKLNKKISQILIRRKKQEVLDQLPNVRQINIPVDMSQMQSDYHSSYAHTISRIIRKKFLTPFDLQRMQMLLSKMRMVCDSTYLIDEETNESPKMAELEDILFEQLDLKNSNRKVIIFSEWVKVHKLIGRLLRENNVGFAELNGKMPVKARGELIRKFESNEQCKVFLSTEAGGAGLNLQVADTLINFELPWNPAKKNQRIGRIDRIGQKSKNLTIFNLITVNSIEQQIATGLLIKQNLFDGVLDGDGNTNFVDFSSKGRSQFIQQLEEFINAQEGVTAQPEPDENNTEEIIGTETISAENEIDLSDDGENLLPQQEVTIEKEGPAKHSPKIEEVEAVMNNGMQFLAGLFKMSTGKDIGIENQKIEVNKETGEVTMKFKLPIF